MTSEDLRSELERHPFVPFRLHLVSGKTVDVPNSGAAFMLQNSVMVFQQSSRDQGEADYDIIGLRNIERLEQVRNLTPTGERHAP